MGKFSGKLLVADFDGTLRPLGQREVPPENREACRYFMEEGGLFTVATGRDPLSFLHIRPLFTINAPAVLSNGVVLFDAETGEDVYEGFLPFSARRDMKAVLEAFPETGMEIIRGLDIRVARNNANITEHLTDMGARVVLSDMDKVMFPWAKTVIITEGDMKAESPRAHEIARWIHEKFPGVYEAVPSGPIVDIAAAGNNKGTGVEKLAMLLDIPRENVCCVGDSWNDLPMLQWAGRAFVPADAIGEIRTQPGVITVGECAHCMRSVVEYLEREG